jgi:hypothetical protein
MTSLHPRQFPQQLQKYIRQAGCKACYKTHKGFLIFVKGIPQMNKGAYPVSKGRNRSENHPN